MTENDTTVYYDDDGTLSDLEDRTIAIIGYGNQGRAQALNLRDSGVESIIVGNREDASWRRAQEDGFPVYRVPKASSKADIVFMLIPDEVAPDVYENAVEPDLDEGNVVIFASGYNITYGFIDPDDGLDVVLVAPRMIGTMVRELYIEDRGAPALLGVHQNPSGDAKEVGLAIAKGIGATRSGVVESSFEVETKTDLMTEQALFPIFVSAMMSKYKIELEAGVSPEVIMLEQSLSREMAYIFQKAATQGIIEQLSLHSQTSQYGQLRGIDAFDRQPIQEYMRECMHRIEKGTFATEWTREQQAGYPTLGHLRKKYEKTEMVEAEQQTLDVFGLREEGTKDED
jgi:ketol-acid reductoisomerase